MSRFTILHICFDYPDTDKRAKTKAIKNLVESVNEFDHIILSLNRKNTPFRTSTETHDNLLVFNVFYPRYGIFLNAFLKRTAKRIAHHIKYKKFDLIHSHKLTFEGVIGDYLSRVFNKKHIITIRGNTDIKVIKAKALSNSFYNKILNRASQLIAVAPWTSEWINLRFSQKYPISILPNISFIENFSRSVNTTNESKFFVTAFLFERNNHRIKNIGRLLTAFKKLISKYPDLQMKMIGSGSQKKIIEKMIKRSGLEQSVHLPGFQNPEQLAISFQNAVAFVMPSFPETFGLVYLEALASGLPVMHSKQAGIDGFFPGSIALSVNHKSIPEIANALERLYLNQLEFKKNVKKYVNSENFKTFQTEKIVSKYTSIVSDLLEI